MTEFTYEFKFKSFPFDIAEPFVTEIKLVRDQKLRQQFIKLSFHETGKNNQWAGGIGTADRDGFEPINAAG